MRSRTRRSSSTMRMRAGVVAERVIHTQDRRFAGPPSAPFGGCLGSPKAVDPVRWTHLRLAPTFGGGHHEPVVTMPCSIARGLSSDIVLICSSAELALGELKPD